VTSKTLAVVAAATLAAGLTASGTAVAGGATRADSTVTIKTENGDFWGQVKSDRPMKCAEGRKVVVFEQVGARQNPRRDKRVASDTASLSGDRYEWNTGNTGLEGKFYARIGRTQDCKPDTSETVRARRD
jgi:hypothetical protein